MHGRQRLHGRRAQAPDERLLEILHPNGQALLSRLSARGPLTLVLDECHHLLEMWGRLLSVILGRLTDPHVIGLTATPPHMMSANQKALHRELFGEIDLEVSAPALVRDVRLAPYQELTYFTTPTPAEAVRAALPSIGYRLTRAGRGVPATVVYHAVPAALGANRKLAQAFARAWNTRVGPGEMLYAGSPEGTGILAAQRGDDPFSVTTQIRTLWR